MADTMIPGFPNASNTGVRPGKALTAYTGPTTITTPGAVIEGKILPGNIQVKANNVTFRDCHIKQTSGWWGINNEGGSSGMTVEYCTFEGPGYSGTSNAAIWAGLSYTLRFNNISKYENGIVCGNGGGYIGGNYIHDLESSGGTGPNAEPHYDGISIQGGQNGVTVEWNTVDARDTSDIFIKNDFGNITNITVKHNLLIGTPGWPIYVYETNNSVTSNISIIENYIEKGGWKGYIAFNGADGGPSNITGYVETGNVKYDEAVGLPPPPPASWALTGAVTDPIQPAPSPVPPIPPTPTPVPPTPTPVPPPVPSTGGTVTGTTGADTLKGGEGPDTISGGSGSDAIQGLGGDDRITGGAANDLMTGGPGADKFVYTSKSHSAPGLGKRDLVYDFVPGVDKVDVSGIKGHWVIEGPGEFPAGPIKEYVVRWRYDAATDRTIIESVTVTQSVVDFQVSLVGKVDLTADDFVLPGE